jgi:transcriptional regulator with XRE-family HTH domain
LLSDENRHILASLREDTDVAKRIPLPVDLLVGQNIRIGRQQKGLSQTELAEGIGVTFQQVQKYEKGTNRVGASRIQLIADVLGVPISTLFDGALGAEPNPQSHSHQYLLAKPHSLRLLLSFGKIKSDATRLALLHMVEGISNSRSSSEVRSGRKRLST